jgi:diguanylate cyclase
VNLSTQLIVFATGLLFGLLLLPALALARGTRLRFVGALESAVARFFSGSYRKAEPALGVQGGGIEAGPLSADPAGSPVDPREQQISDSAQAVRSILLILTAVIERTEQAASESSQALKKLRESFDRAGLPAEVAAATSRLTEQIDRMISNNASLKEKLASSQKILSAQQRQIEMLRTAVLVDGMTQLANRSYFDDKLGEMIKLRQRYDEVFFLIILDVDRFKSINDTHGHPAGDQILREVAARIRSALRESDFVARFGGDEFAVILIKSTPQAAEAVAGKLCNSVREGRFSFEGADIAVTLSIGAAEATAFDTAESLVERADAALYRVKESGRDGVFFAVNPVSESAG